MSSFLYLIDCVLFLFSIECVVLNSLSISTASNMILS